MADDTHIFKKSATLQEAVALGCENVLPDAFVVEPGRRYERSVFVCVRPLRIGDGQGSDWDHAVGDLLSASDALASGSGLQALVGRGDVVELDADSGLPALFAGLLERVDRLEHAIALSALPDAELFALAVRRGLVSTDSRPAA